MLKLENVKKSYDGTTVLDGINLEIEDVEIYVSCYTKKRQTKWKKEVRQNRD